MLSTNYGLAGGTLDASKHIEAARLLTPSEREDYHVRTLHGARLPVSVVAGLAAGRMQAESN